MDPENSHGYEHVSAVPVQHTPDMLSSENYVQEGYSSLAQPQQIVYMQTAPTAPLPAPPLPEKSFPNAPNEPVYYTQDFTPPASQLKRTSFVPYEPPVEPANHSSNYPQQDVSYPQQDVTLSAENSKAAQNSFCCGCFKSRSTCIMCWCCIVLLFLVGIGLAVFFVFPRINRIDVSDPFIPQQQTDTVKVVGTPLTATAENPFSLSVKFAIDVVVDSSSFVSYDGTLLDDAGTSIPEIKLIGDKLNSIVYKQQITTITLPVMLNYSTTALNLSQDKMLALLLSKCSNQGGDLKFELNTELTLPLISWTGYRPNIIRTSTVKCPVDVGSFISSGLGSLPSL